MLPLQLHLVLDLIHHLDRLTEEYVRTTDTNFNTIVRPLLDLEGTYGGGGTYGPRI